MENTTITTTSLYGVGKYTRTRPLEATLRWHPQNALPIFRPSTVYGLRDTGSGYGLITFLQAALNGQPIALRWNGWELLKLVSVSDVANIVYHLAFSNFSVLLNVASESSHSYWG